MSKTSGAVLGIRAGEAAGPALVRFGHDILAEARAALRSTDGARTVVHDFRKAMKRWRAFLRLLKPVVGDAAVDLRRQARDLARELASARDVQAALDALADLGGCASPLSARSRAAIAQRIESRRQSAQDAGLTDDIRARIAAYLERADLTLSAWPLDKTEFKDITAPFARACDRARRLVPKDWAAASPEELHTLRQRVVIHRYQLDFMHPLWPRFIKVAAGEAQRLRERLGHCQDLAVLTALTQPRGDLARWRKLLLPLIDERKATHIAAAAHNAGRLFADRPKALQKKLHLLWENPAEPSP